MALKFDFLRNTDAQIAIFMVVAALFGGGGGGAGLANLVVQLLALVLLALHPQAVIDLFRRAPKIPAVLIGLCLALPLLQSIPLPPALWQALPGRDVAREALALAGEPDAWMPMSLQVQRTLTAFVALLPPLAVIALTWNLPSERKRQLLLVLVALGIFTILLGARQLVAGNRSAMLFAETYGARYLLGNFANHSTTGLYIDLALCALVGALPRTIAAKPNGETSCGAAPDIRWVMGSGAAAVLLLVGLVLAGSRSAMVLALVPLGLAVLRVSGRIARPIAWPKVAVGLAVVALVLGAGALLASHNELVQKNLARFENLADTRPLIWEDAKVAISRFWPVGSGIGTFDEVFQLDETLENLSPRRAARAHNDFLEAGLESGLAGLILIGLWLAFLAVRAVQAFKAGWRASYLPIVAEAGLGVITLQSISDFPLRNQTILCVAALLLSLLIDPPQNRRISAVDRKYED